MLYEWLLAHGESVLTGDSFFHLGGYGAALPGLNLCGAGRVVCLIDPIGDVYACPFVIHDEFLAGNVREPGGFARVWRESDLFLELREPQHAGACSSCGLFDKCRGGCMAAKFFTGLPLAGPDPECVLGHGERAAGRPRREAAPKALGRHVEEARPGAGLRREPSSTELKNLWFESVAVAQRRAKKRLPRSVYSALLAGSEAGITLADNVAAFGELGFAPHVGGAPAHRDMTTTVMGQEISLPVLISPTGVQSVHPEGEVAVARAAAARSTAMGLSSFASKPMEEVVAANPQTFFQLYWAGGREQIAGAHRTGARRRSARADRHARLDASRTAATGAARGSRTSSTSRRWLRLAPEVLVRPGWLVEWARAGGPPDLTVPNVSPLGAPPDDLLRRLRRVDDDRAPELG